MEFHNICGFQTIGILLLCLLISYAVKPWDSSEWIVTIDMRYRQSPPRIDRTNFEEFYKKSEPNVVLAGKW